MLTITCAVHGGGFDGLGANVSGARIDLGPERIKRIKRLSEEVNRLGVYKIVEFDYRVTLLSEDEAGEEFEGEGDDEVRTECDCMNVTDYGVFWSGYIKHTDDKWETEAIALSLLVDGATIDTREN